MVIEHSDRLPQRPHHIPLGGMKGRGGAEPPRDRRPRPRPHPPYPLPHTPYPPTVGPRKDVFLSVPGNDFAELDATSRPHPKSGGEGKRRRVTRGRRHDIE